MTDGASPEVTASPTRMARCGGLLPTDKFKCGCGTCRAKITGKEGPRCTCEAPSANADKLAFFQAQPDQPYDRYYCGCSGWD